jgi:hypothetical protein
MGKLRTFATADELDMQETPCEAAECVTTRPRRECFSFIASMQHIHLEKGVYSSYQCPNEQHWCCCHDHAYAAVVACLNEHHSTEQLIPYTGGGTQAFGLPDHITHCALASCDQPLTTEAYMVPVCYATPGLGYPAFACTDTHWSCSEAHAKLAAEACLEEHLSEEERHAQE